LRISRRPICQALPEHTELTLQQLERTERELAEIKQQSRNLKEQQNHLEAELSLADPYSPFIQSTGERVLSDDARLKLLRSELASLQAQFTDAHPEVQRTRREIAALQNNQQDLQTSPPDNPAYLQLSTRLKNVQIERESLDLRRQDLQQKLLTYENRLATTPVIERRYRELLQEFESSSLKYREIKAKQQEAMLAFSLETEQKGERFTLLEPAVTPEKPVKPNRMAIFMVGMILSFGLAAGMVYLRENTDRSVHDKDELKDLLGIMPLSVVPYIETRREQNAVRTKLRHTLYGAIVSVVVGVMLFHLLVKPLDVVWFVVTRKLGA
jgi:succinoglycan biosynthesis transport protein ExoP